MPYAIELYFDPDTDAAVRHMWQAISDAGLASPMLEAGYRPHVSLAVYDSDDLDVAELKRNLVAHAKTIPPLSLELPSVGIFPTAEGVIFLGVAVTKELLAIHEGFHSAFEQYASALRPYYRVGHWVPHCTLAYGLSTEELAAVVRLCRHVELPPRGWVQEIGVAKVSPVSCELLFACNL